MLVKTTFQKPFLTANWRYLAMMNYRVDPKLLVKYIPPGVELDFHNGETFLSLVAFLFLDTRILGLAIPRHRDFEEVNLRFYVRKRSADTWRRGVCFVREIVPRHAIAAVARVFYGEPYLALPMKSDIAHRDGGVQVEYSWRRRKKWEALRMSAAGNPVSLTAGSHEEFITEHYWGYTKLREGCSEYRVEHPRWKVWPASSASLEAEIDDLYGGEFVEPLSESPFSQFIAEGSHVQVRRRSDDPVLAEAIAEANN
jgi:uncharacterized protein YqjF (DUF2071 family)